MFDYFKIDINNLVKYLNDNIDKFSYANIDKFSYQKIDNIVEKGIFLTGFIYYNDYTSDNKKRTSEITILSDFNLILPVDKTINEYINKYLLENYNLERIIL